MIKFFEEKNRDLYMIEREFKLFVLYEGFSKPAYMVEGKMPINPLIYQYFNKYII